MHRHAGFQGAQDRIPVGVQHERRLAQRGFKGELLRGLRGALRGVQQLVAVEVNGVVGVFQGVGR